MFFHVGRGRVVGRGGRVGRDVKVEGEVNGVRGKEIRV